MKKIIAGGGLHAKKIIVGGGLKLWAVHPPPPPPHVFLNGIALTCFHVLLIGKLTTKQRAWSHMEVT